MREKIYGLVYKLESLGFKGDAKNDAIKFIIKHMIEKKTSLFLHVIQNGGIMLLRERKYIELDEHGAVDLSKYNTTLTPQDIVDAFYKEIMSKNIDLEYFQMSFGEREEFVSGHTISFSNDDIVNKISQLLNNDTYDEGDLYFIDKILYMYKESLRSEKKISEQDFYLIEDIRDIILEYTYKYLWGVLNSVYLEYNNYDTFAKFLESEYDKIYEKIKDKFYELSIEEVIKYDKLINNDKLRYKFVKDLFSETKEKFEKFGKLDEYSKKYYNKDIMIKEIYDASDWEIERAAESVYALIDSFYNNADESAYDNYRKVILKELKSFIEDNRGKKWLPYFLYHDGNMREFIFYNEDDTFLNGEDDISFIYNLFLEANIPKDIVITKMYDFFDEEEVEDLIK